ncbi:hypothetical protein ATANTOWER_025385 [Ataeniobius toweri]|uniref:Uncharacterized protein n=1 Tax=Ataeniobius toweri TaxID=208326 RepID=A0ABU7AWB9_9TELE|nr:hypothetical protein [Ataeniobius toweri]
MHYDIKVLLKTTKQNICYRLVFKRWASLCIFGSGVLCLSLVGILYPKSNALLGSTITYAKQTTQTFSNLNKCHASTLFSYYCRSDPVKSLGLKSQHKIMSRQELET